MCMIHIRFLIVKNEVLRLYEEGSNHNNENNNNNNNNNNKSLLKHEEVNAVVPMGGVVHILQGWPSVRIRFRKHLKKSAVSHLPSPQQQQEINR